MNTSLTISERDRSQALIILLFRIRDSSQRTHGMTQRLRVSSQELIRSQWDHQCLGFIFISSNLIPWWHSRTLHTPQASSSNWKESLSQLFISSGSKSPTLLSIESWTWLGLSVWSWLTSSLQLGTWSTLRTLSQHSFECGHWSSCTHSSISLLHSQDSLPYWWGKLVSTDSLWIWTVSLV